ncbi:MAG: CapA family protein [Gammaproteobacteria bacterium]|nr:CapA family protein [Gammaproteobacteria bacterium]
MNSKVIFSRKIDDMPPNTIVLAGDWAPGVRKVEQLGFESQLIFNLEGPVLEGDFSKYLATHKAGPSLRCFELPINKHKGIAILANNHFMDFGATGLEASCQKIRSDGWLGIGAGKSKLEAESPVILQLNNTRIGFLARCETQFGIASNHRAGVAAFDATIYEQIKKLKVEADFVIASVHAAAEMLPWPSPKRQRTWRSLIDAGADIVHGHHAHVPQGWEKYNEGLILYGLGNFCVDPEKWHWHPQGLWSFAPQLSFINGKIEMQPKTTLIDDLGVTIRVRDSDQTEQKQHLEYLKKCNQPLANSFLLEGIWQEASIRMYHEFYSRWLGFRNSFPKNAISSLRHSLGCIKRAVPRQQSSVSNPLQSRYLLWYHLFACDSHNDAISTALGVLSGELEDCRTEKTARIVDEMLVSK